RRPPRPPTPCPYTTLFRSTFTSPTEQALALEELAVSKSIAVKSSGTSSCSHGHPTLTDAARSAGHGSLDSRGSHYRNRRTPQRGDRKSTRLNSSHVKISYA